MQKININTNVRGLVRIIDQETGEVVFDDHNDIHAYNFSRLITSALCKGNNAIYINSMKFGNGGVFIDSNGNTNFSQPNVNLINATLYNTTWVEYFNNADNPLNSIDQVTNAEDVSSSLLVKVVLGPNRPSGQAATDNTSSTPYIPVSDSLVTSQNPFVFSEIGLFDNQDNLLTHVIFSPIEKTANRTLIIEYTLVFLVN